MTRRWPLLLLALPAFVATWSGWVGLGELTGFGPVKPLPGIADQFTINTAITLPIGVETYAAYALGAWLSGRPLGTGTRAFAKWSAIGSLGLGMLGQIAYHLLVTAGLEHTPWQIVTAVSCLPVLVLGMGAALGHMLHRDAHKVPSPASAEADAVLADVPAVERVPEPEPDPVGEHAIATLKAFSRRVNGGILLPAVPAAPVALDTPQVPMSREVYDWATERSLFGTSVAESAPEPVDVPAEVAPDAAETPVLGPVPDELCPAAAVRYADELAEGKVPALNRIKKDLRIGQKRATRIQTYLGQLAGV
ncbi:hypothetical protein [Microbispora sp. CSR-4]|uniref:hypothetical protein n=1 Tax=Microbispora sp. CSR-4 TaxID=2592813 RepID=UPI0021C8D8C3|nr:hypothetical protein [Microbispora sp. CSR-4]